MKKSFIYLIVLLLLSVAAGVPAFSCTGVLIDKGNIRMIGRTMDWKTGDGNVVVNERGISKEAQFLQDKSAPAKWSSNYASLTFNLNVKFAWYVKLLAWLARVNTSSGPSCGINEKGLYGGSYWIHPPPQVKYPSRDGRPSINDWELLQYLFDTSANVNEALRNLKKVRVSGFKEGDFEVDIHWFIADASGDSAIIEFPDGRVEVHRNPVPPVITNSFYEHSREYSKQFTGFGGNKPVPLDKGEMTSENRFVFASYLLGKNKNENKLSKEDVFKMMKAVTQTNVRHMETSQSITQWTTVYDLNSRKFWWFSRTSPDIKWIDMTRIYLAATGKPRYISINTKLTGDLTYDLCPPCQKKR